MLFNQLRYEFAALESDIGDGPIVPVVTAEEIRSHLISRYDFTRKVAIDELIADVEEMLRNWQVQVTHPRYFGLFNPSVAFASVIADTFVGMYNPQLANWRTSPVANEIERYTWLARREVWSAGGLNRNLHQRGNGGTFRRGGRVNASFPDYGEHGLRRSPECPQFI